MKAEYIDHMGDDLRVANAARVSFDKESEWDQVAERYYDVEADTYEWSFGPRVLKDADKRIINFLARENHFTPFTHGMITMRETVPIFVARQRFKHTVGFTYNEISRRYVDASPEFHVPEVWRGRPAGSVKQGSSEDVVITDIAYENNVESWTNPIDMFYANHCESSLNLYEAMIKGGVCPEQARMVLPQSMMTSYYVTGSLAAFARAYGLRKDPHAQLEIQLLADQWDAIIRPLFPHSWSALLGENT